MAADPANGVTYYLSLPMEHKDYLGAIRHWTNGKIGFEEDLVWIRDLLPGQVESVEVKSLPFKRLYYAGGAKLFPLGSLLPERTLPALLWTPIERGLPVQLPAFNHNYFGIPDRIEMRLVPSDEEREAFGLIASLSLIQTYIVQAPAIRLQHLQWTILDETEALLLGNPLLPLPGAVCWRMGDFLVPAGYELELPALSGALQEVLNPGGDHWVIWQQDGSYYKVEKKAMQSLSIGSFRASMSNE